MNLYKEMQGRKSGIEQGAVFHETSKVGENVYVGAFTCVSEKVKIGDESQEQICPLPFVGGICKSDIGVSEIMDYISAINQFWRLNNVEKFTPYEVNLYFYLLGSMSQSKIHSN